MGGMAALCCPWSGAGHVSGVLTLGQGQAGLTRFNNSVFPLALLRAVPPGCACMLLLLTPHCTSCIRLG